MALYSSLKIFGLVPFFLCSLLTLAFRHEDVHQSPNSRDHILLFSRGSAIVSLSCYLIFHLFLNITHAPLVSTAPPTSTVAAPPPPPPPSTRPPPLLPFLATLLTTILTSRNLVHALALLPASPSSSPPPLPPAMLAPAPLYAILLPIALNHHELLAAVRAAHLPQLRQHSPHHILAVLTEAPTVHATLFLAPSLVLLGWMAGGGRDVGMEIGGGEAREGGRGGGRSASSARMAVVLLLLCGLGAWLDSVVAAGRRGGRLLVLKGWVLVSL
ncbi:hypothetical protein DBV05_g2395 [Lasiodiplodia theobromae]|uniref:Uncharacterized protein n=1 Tax=Lasiodiplodia theobromae TaxID=45133 RepID=A0A5N5DMR1_9PEZI|nr:hypothetical protein DBV05_g2395 [Lasiodiplodia theobromae]